MLSIRYLVIGPNRLIRVFLTPVTYEPVSIQYRAIIRFVPVCARMRMRLGWMRMMLILARLLALSLWMLVLAGVIACQTSGQGIVYVSEVDGDAEIYLVDPDSGQSAPVERLPSSTESDPRWSPDGKYVAFVTSQSGNLDIRVASVDTEEPSRTLTSSEGNEESPRWNADSDQVAYVTDLDGHSDVYVKSLEGESPARITSADTEEFLGHWSPDGQWLVFTRRGNEESRGLWLRNPAGVNLFRLTTEDDLAPTWSPDADAIAFVRNVDGNRDIYLLLPEDDDDWRGPVKAQPLITSPAADHSPGLGPGRRYPRLRFRARRQPGNLRPRNRRGRPAPALDYQRSSRNPASLVAGRQAYCLRLRPARGGRDIRHGRRRQQPATADAQRCQRPLAGLVSNHATPASYATLSPIRAINAPWPRGPPSWNGLQQDRPHHGQPLVAHRRRVQPVAGAGQRADMRVHWGRVHRSGASQGHSPDLQNQPQPRDDNGQRSLRPEFPESGPTGLD